MSRAEHDYNEELALKRCLPKEDILDFDSCLKQCSLFTGIADKDNTIAISNKSKVYNTLVLIFLYSNLVRTTVECFLPKGSQWFLYLGDFKPWWGEPYIAHQVVFYMAVLVVPAICTLNMTANESLRRWCLPFRYVQGMISATEAKIYKVSIAKKLRNKMKFSYRKAFFATFSVNIPYSISVFVSFFIFCTNWTQFIVLGIPWTVYESLWSFFICSNMGLLPASFEVVCYYLRLRYEQIDKLLDQLNADFINHKSNLLSLLDRRQKLKRLLILLNDANNDVMDFDKYWSKYTAIVFVSYIPQLLFELYVLLFLPMNTPVMLFSILLNCNIFALITQMAMFSAVLHLKVRLETDKGRVGCEIHHKSKIKEVG